MTIAPVQRVVTAAQCLVDVHVRQVQSAIQNRADTHGHIPRAARLTRRESATVQPQQSFTEPKRHQVESNTGAFTHPLMLQSGPGGAGGAGGIGGGGGGGGNGGGGGSGPAAHGHAAFLPKPSPHETLPWPLHRNTPRHPSPAHIQRESLLKHPNRPYGPPVHLVLDACLCSATLHPSASARPAPTAPSATSVMASSTTIQRRAAALQRAAPPTTTPGADCMAERAVSPLRAA